MKEKFDLKMILGIILGFVLSVTGVKAYSIMSLDVGYNPASSNFTLEGNKVTNVKDALDVLYNQSGDVIDKMDGTHLKSQYVGELAYGSGTTITLTKGNWYVYISESAGYHDTISREDINDRDLSSNADLILNYNGAECELLSTRQNRKRVSSNVSSNYNSVEFDYFVLKCSVNSTGTVKVQALDTASKSPYNATIHAIKID